jgi:hypothetical protein
MNTSREIYRAAAARWLFDRLCSWVPELALRANPGMGGHLSRFAKNQTGECGLADSSADTLLWDAHPVLFAGWLG